MAKECPYSVRTTRQPNCTICCGCARRHTVCACVQLLAVLWQVSDSLRCGYLEFRRVFSCAFSSEGYVAVFCSCAYAANVELTPGSDMVWWLVVANAECHRPSVMQGQTCNMRWGVLRTGHTVLHMCSRAYRGTQPHHRTTCLCGCRHMQSLHLVSLVESAVLRLILHVLHNSSF
jgi:hypothetical protein